MICLHNAVACAAGDAAFDPVPALCPHRDSQTPHISRAQPPRPGSTSRATTATRRMTPAAISASRRSPGRGARSAGYENRDARGGSVETRHAGASSMVSRLSRGPPRRSRRDPSCARHRASLRCPLWRGRRRCGESPRSARGDRASGAVRTGCPAAIPWRKDASAPGCRHAESEERSERERRGSLARRPAPYNPGLSVPAAGQAARGDDAAIGARAIRVSRGGAAPVATGRLPIVDRLSRSGGACSEIGSSDARQRGQAGMSGEKLALVGPMPCHWRLGTTTAHAHPADALPLAGIALPKRELPATSLIADDDRQVAEAGHRLAALFQDNRVDRSNAHAVRGSKRRVDCRFGPFCVVWGDGDPVPPPPHVAQQQLGSAVRSTFEMRSSRKPVASTRTSLGGTGSGVNCG